MERAQGAKSEYVLVEASAHTKPLMASILLSSLLINGNTWTPQKVENNSHFDLH